ncbi:MAG: cupredoxin domain-containing protein [Actinobacteria bacterium]|nr:cupredoxin domain-containing protein [Actinomycetota bacterium]
MRRTGIAAVVFAIGIVVPACQSDGIGAPVDESRAGYGGMGIRPPASPDGTVPLLGPETFPCQRGTDGAGYTKYGVGRMRRGGLEPEKLERDHVMIDGHGVNFHGSRRVVDGGTIEMEMDEDYFGPTVLKGPAGATVTIELENEGIRAHNFSVLGQDIDLDCGVRARDEVEVVFPRSGLLAFTCKFGATSGMRGALTVTG